MVVANMIMHPLSISPVKKNVVLVCSSHSDFQQEMLRSRSMDGFTESLSFGRRVGSSAFAQSNPAQFQDLDPAMI
jgi:hypothetical protein